MSRWLCLACLLCLAAQLLLRAYTGLSVDETHYALYGAHPAASYFDHPPLVGWLQMPFVWLGGQLGDPDWMLRVAPLMLFGLAAYGLYRFSVWALLLFLLSPIHQLLGLALLPDSLLMPLTLWVMWLSWRLMQDAARNATWLWLGIALGLAGLAKYSSLFLALGVAIVLLAQHKYSLFKRSGLWLSIAIACVLITPVLVWNAQHDWASFAYQWQHLWGGGGNSVHAGGDGLDGEARAPWEIKRALSFVAIQWLSYGVLPLIGLLAFMCKLNTRLKDEKRLFGLCLAFALPAFLFVFYSAGRVTVLPHWLASSWIALMPVSALGLADLWNRQVPVARLGWRVLLSALAALQVLFMLGLGSAMALGGHWDGKAKKGLIAQERGNPFADLHDWRQAGQLAQQLQSEYHAQALAVSNWTLASRLAWYARPLKVWTLDHKNKQFDYWFGSPPVLATSLLDAASAGKPSSGHMTKNALENDALDIPFIWVNWSQMPFDRPSRCRAPDSLVDVYHGQHSVFYFYLCQ